ncbi:PRC-barrel domain-containing protein [Hyphomicrobium sp.]|uniref:PRC-barrel domain-containing protein n=1 Tax=Hyphomicrobium sp. TaxID=82 RepID=UPI002E37D956|nr:PRC-barrel domain-containing protein [Hyphomicrobium sp.]HEX2839760.1 PRC-barrel domain-containing protein [Hyphomicrobium sp.]
MMSRISLGLAALLLTCGGTLAFAQPIQSDQTDPAISPRATPSAPTALPPIRFPGDEKTTSDWRASKLIGTTMTNILDESIGKVEDVVIDSDGKVVAVLVGVGGFLGLGETTVAIGLPHLVISHADLEHLQVKTSLSRKAIEQAASMDPAEEKSVAP